jgi:hypothetical protein
MRTQRSLCDKYDIQLMVVNKRLSVSTKAEGSWLSTRREYFETGEMLSGMAKEDAIFCFLKGAGHSEAKERPA